MQSLDGYEEEEETNAVGLYYFLAVCTHIEYVSRTIALLEQKMR